MNSKLSLLAILSLVSAPSFALDCVRFKVNAEQMANANRGVNADEIRAMVRTKSGEMDGIAENVSAFPTVKVSAETFMGCAERLYSNVNGAGRVAYLQMAEEAEGICVYLVRNSVSIPSNEAFVACVK